MSADSHESGKLKGTLGHAKGAGGPPGSDGTVPPGAGGMGPPAGPSDPWTGEPAPEPPSGGWPKWLIPAGVAAVVMLVVGGFVATRVIFGDQDDPVTVELVAANDPGPSPFTTDASRVSLAEITAARRAGDGASVSWSNRGSGLRVSPVAATIDRGAIYGVRRTSSVCDVAEMARSLRSNPPARQAWASLMGVEENRVDDLLDAFTPLVLTRDTAVTSSIYSGGEGEWFQAILQSGTAVLVDSTGVPRVQCACGNPLVSPARDLNRVRIVGDEWDGYRSDQIIDVQPVPDGETEIPAVDVEKDEIEPTPLPAPGTETSAPKPQGTTTSSTEPEAPAAETVSLDGYLVDDADGVHVVDEDGERTRVLGRAVSAVFDDGAGGLVFQYERMDSEADYFGIRKDTINQMPADVEEASIWWLPAEAETPELVLESEDPSTHWYSLQDVGDTVDGRQMAYLEMRDPLDCESEGGCWEFGSQTAKRRDLGDDSTTELAEVSRARQVDLGGTNAFIRWFDAEGDDSGLDVVDLDGSDLVTIPCGDGCDESEMTIVDDDHRFSTELGPPVTGRRCVIEEGGGGDCEHIEFDITLDLADDLGGNLVTSIVGDTAYVTFTDEAQNRAEVFAVDLSGGELSVRPLDTGGRTTKLSAPLLRPTEAVTSAEPEPPVDEPDEGDGESPTEDDLRRVRNAWVDGDPTLDGLASPDAEIDWPMAPEPTVELRWAIPDCLGGSSGTGLCEMWESLDDGSIYYRYEIGFAYRPDPDDESTIRFYVDSIELMGEL